MNLVNAEHCFEMHIEEGSINVLIIEKKELFSKFIMDLLGQIGGNEGNFVLSENGKEFRLDKYASMVVDVFSMDINEKKIVNRLYAKMIECTDEYLEEKEEINAKIVSLLENLSLKMPFQNLEYNLELDWNTLLKFYAVRMQNEYMNILEKLEDFLKISVYLCDLKLIFFVNLKTFLSEQEILSLYEMAIYLKLPIVLLETEECIKLPNEKIQIIDKDLCNILK